ncbi:MAG: cation-transporting P-type ATPase [Spirochaetia bacterium]|nr:cation-transporting P-type ATPase [Spirochaetia bacterium]
MRIHQLSVEEAVRSLGSGPQGLEKATAAQRIREFGPNRIERAHNESTLIRFLKEFTHFFAIILWIAAALSLLAEWQAPGQGMLRLAVAIVIVILVSGAFSFWQEQRAERTLEALLRLLPLETEVLRGGVIERVSADGLVPGDIICLEEGANVPADCRLIDGFSVLVNNASVTGESVPVARIPDACPAHELLHSTNILLAGTSVVSGRGRALVIATGSRTHFGTIAQLSQTQRAVSPLRVELARLSRWIVRLALGIGVAFFAAGWFVGIAPWNDFILAIGIIVAMVPEGLLPTLTLALVLAAQKMARKHVLIRHLPAVEALGSVTVICTDKTGTLTESKMHVREVWLGGETYAADTLENVAHHYEPFLKAAGLCHDLRESAEASRRTYLGDPMEIALLELQRRYRPQPEAVRVGEIPFDAHRMRLSTIYTEDHQTSLYCKGAAESVLPLCGNILMSGRVMHLDDTLRSQIVSVVESMSQSGLRVLAFAYKNLESPSALDIATGKPAGVPSLEVDMTFTGLAALDDPPRPEVAGAIQKCRTAGIRVIMITGDHPSTAAAIARQIGLSSQHPVTIAGSHIDNLSDVQLQMALDKPDLIFARASPEQKMRIVEALKRKNHIVAVTGDGVNDAPALKSAHVGIAMGRSGTDVAKESSDMILLDDNFATIVSAIEEGRAVFDNIRKFLTYILAHNVPELVPYLGFVLFKIPLALTPIQMLSVDMGTDSMTALGLGVEDPEPDIMNRPPRPRDEALLSLPLALRAYLFLGLFEAAVSLAAFFVVLHAGGWVYGQMVAPTDLMYKEATTACLTAIILLQIVNVFLCRSHRRSLFSVGLGGNRLILLGVLWEAVLLGLIAYTPLGNALFDTAPPGPMVWLFIVPFTLFFAAAEEIRKKATRVMYAKTSAGA